MHRTPDVNLTLRSNSKKVKGRRAGWGSDLRCCKGVSMAEFEVNISLDIERFEAAITDWSKQVRIQNHLGSMEAATFIQELVQENLLKWPHPPGTPTIAPELKGPVGYITGRLRDSIEVNEKAIAGFATVGTSLVYARIQEIGGWTGKDHMSYIPPRPYFRPMVMELDTTGPEGVEHIFYERWRQAMMIAIAY
jgi:phage gpG-like protein